MRASRFAVLRAILLACALSSFGCSQERGLDLVGPPTGLEQDSGGTFYVAPPGYYDAVDATNGATLRLTLHDVIDDHTRFPYTSTSTDTWDVLEAADQDPNDPNRILDLYRNESYPKYGGGNTDYNREHSWPKSYGFPNDGAANYPYTDCHHLFLANDSYNSSRSNKPFRNGDASWSEQVTVANGGVGGGSGVYPGNSNWTTGSFTTGGWEVWGDRRGDVARALFYLDVRYEGGTHGVTGVIEPDLVLTDDEALIAASNTGANETVGYMGMLSVLLAWHAQDPVDAKERARNDVVYSFQGNRNPFIDHPEWVDCVFTGACGGGGGGDTTPPSAPTGLIATGGTGGVDLDWDDNTESDLAGYDVYRADQSAGPFTRINTVMLSSSAYVDTDVVAGATYTYRVTASDLSANESAPSGVASATVNGGGGGTGPSVAWINEFHYDNAGTDTGEFVEIAGTAGLDLTGWSVVGYNGNGGVVYATVSLSGTLADAGAGFGFRSFAFAAMQNGSPDALALVDAQGAVVEFLSYEGTLVATDGPAVGTTSTDVGVAEATDTPIGWSLQRTGSGSVAGDFVWTGPAASSPDLLNAGQSFGGGNPPDTTPPAAPTGLVAVASEGTVDLDWDDNGESDFAGYDLLRATNAGGPYGVVNSGLLSTSAYTDAGLTNGTTYFYVVQAVDTAGNASSSSAEVSATPQAMVAVDPWINEFHYDDKGGDQNEFVEIAGPAGTDLTGWSVVGYNGGDGAPYGSVALSGSIPDQQSGYGTVFVYFSGLQNGSPDGIALVDAQGGVVEFVSYEGSFTAASGPAAGFVSTDVGVFENGNGSANDSIQRTGTGSQGSDFTWAGPQRHSRGNVNSGQSFVAPRGTAAELASRKDVRVRG